MTFGERIVKNSAVLTASHVLSKLINLALVLILTRLLGSDGFGIYSFSLAFVMLFMVFTHLGINTLLIREIARDKSRAKELVGTTLPVILIGSLLVFVLVNGITFLTNWTEQERIVIFVFSIFLVFESWSRFFIVVFRAFERMGFEALINVVERFGFLIFSILAWIFTFSLETLISCFAGVQLIKALLTYSLTKNYFTEIDLKWQPARLMSIFKQAYPFALMGLFGTVSMRIDTIMLKIFHTDAIVGIYNVARKLMESITFIPENISYALFPALSVLYLTQKRQFDRTFQRTFHYLMFVAILIVIVLFILSPQIINLLFEPEFARAYIPLRWLSLALGILFMKFAFTALMSAIGKQHLLSILAGIGMLINVGLNYLLIPDYDILGASLASVVSEAIIIITIIIVIRKTINLPELALPIFKALLAGLVLAVIVYLIQSWNIFLVLILAGLFYLSLLAALKVVSKEDVQYFYQFFQKRLFS